MRVEAVIESFCGIDDRRHDGDLTHRSMLGFGIICTVARDLMTIGELARRSGLSPKAIRDFEARGLIYSAGRSVSNYRLFDESALWCVEVIRNLRGLGLTLKEIEQLAVVYLEKPDEAAGPKLDALLERAQRRVEERLAELEIIWQRIDDYRRRNRERTGAADSRPSSGPRTPPVT